MTLWRVFVEDFVPAGITHADLGRKRMPKSCWVYGRAESRVAFARKLAAAPLGPQVTRSVAAISSWVRHQGAVVTSRADLAMVPSADDTLYVRAPTCRPGCGDEWVAL